MQDSQQDASMLVRLLKALDSGGYKQIESMCGVRERLLQNLDALVAHPAAAEKLKELLLLKGCMFGANYTEMETASYVVQYVKHAALASDPHFSTHVSSVAM